MSPLVIGSFAALDAAVIAQTACALRDYQRRGENQRRRLAAEEDGWRERPR